MTDDDNTLQGVLRMRDLLFPSRTTRLEKLMISKPYTINVSDSLEDLRNFFESTTCSAFRWSTLITNCSALSCRKRLKKPIKAEHKTVLGLSGIVGGEEFRSMPLLSRSGRRLSWLSLNIILNIAAASVIALYQDTLAAVIALAVFLPMVSDMSGCSGNQAVAVSMRELSLGLVRPAEILRVLKKEISLGLLNGLVLGLLLGAVAYLWKGNLFLGLVVGGSLALNTIVAVCLGGLIPLALKQMKLDPALVSSPAADHRNRHVRFSLYPQFCVHVDRQL